MILFDTHNELLIQPYQKGVKLIRPENAPIPLPSIGSLFAMPMLVYFVTTDERFVNANHSTCLANIPGNQGYYSHNELRGAKFINLFAKETVEAFKHNNNMVTHVAKQMVILDETANLLDEKQIGVISFKFPVYNAKNQRIGLFGISALSDNTKFPEADKLTAALEKIINTGLIASAGKNELLLPGFAIGDIYFSHQEEKCIRLLVAGKTIKLISEHMVLSPKTVEHYLEKIKQKLNVKSKAELIEKIFQQIWPEILL